MMKIIVGIQMQIKIHAFILYVLKPRDYKRNFSHLFLCTNYCSSDV